MACTKQNVFVITDIPKLNLHHPTEHRSLSMSKNPPPMPWGYRLVAIFLFIVLLTWIAFVVG